MKLNKIMRVVKHYALQGMMSLALIATFVSVNTPCVGPGYQPKLPVSAMKFKRD